MPPRKPKRLVDQVLASVKQAQDHSYAKYAVAVAAVMLETLFGQQHALATDLDRFRSVICGRRAGKTYCFAVIAIRGCLLQPAANWFYVAITTRNAKRIIWDMLKHLDKEYELGAKFHNNDLTMTFPNLSRITLVGAETQMDIDKLRGIAIDGVIIDEAGSFPPPHLKNLIQEAIGPTLNDRLGCLIIGGTPGKVLKGPFYEATAETSNLRRPYARRTEARYADRPYAWSGHGWHVQDNVAMPHLWDAALAEKNRNGWADDNPIWLREYMGRWIADDSVLVYRYNWNAGLDTINNWTRLPAEQCDNPWGLPSGHDWHFLMGIDFGWTDDFALEVGAYAPTCPVLYQVYEDSDPQLTVGQMAERIRRAVDTFGEFDAMVADQGALANTLIATLADEYGFPVIPADKREKKDFIELMNSDLHEGRVKILAESGLAMDWQFLCWDAHRKKEAAHFKNHRADAFLYMWRYSQHRRFEQVQAGPEAGTEAYWMLAQRREVEEMIQKEQRRAQIDEYDYGIGSLDAEDARRERMLS